MTNTKQINNIKNKGLKIITSGLVYLFSFLAFVVILGLATKGLSIYFKDMTDSTRTIASIAGVSFLAFVATIKLFNK